MGNILKKSSHHQQASPPLALPVAPPALAFEAGSRKPSSGKRGSKKRAPAPARGSMVLRTSTSAGNFEVAATDGKSRREVCKVAVRARKTLIFSCAVDTSYSMHGELLSTATTGLKEIVRGVVRPGDLFGCYFFDDKVTQLHRPMAIERVALERDVAAIHAASGGCTAFYDAVAQGIQDLREVVKYRKDGGHTDDVIEHFVITDGADNRSATSLAELVELVKKPGLPNYHLIVIGVGLDASTQRELQEICRPRHARCQFAVDAAALQAAMRSANEQLNVKLTCTDGRSTTTSEYTGTDGRAAVRMVERNSQLLAGGRSGGLLRTIAGSGGGRGRA